MEVTQRFLKYVSFDTTSSETSDTVPTTAHQRVLGQYLADADAAGKKVLFEAQLGALRDIDFGIYPLSLIHI